MTRDTQEVFDSHVEAIETMNLDQLAADYAEDAFMVTLDGSFHGREAIITDFFMAWLGQFPDTKITFEKTAISDDVCLLLWSAEASKMTIPVGIGVFFVQNGMIVRQAEWFQMELKEG